MIAPPPIPTLKTLPLADGAEDTTAILIQWKDKPGGVRHDLMVSTSGTTLYSGCR